MNEKTLCDTCILIDFMNGKSQDISQRANALIAATALVYKLTLFTLNTNDFKCIPILQILPIKNIENYR